VSSQAWNKFLSGGCKLLIFFVLHLHEVSMGLWVMFPTFFLEEVLHTIRTLPWQTLPDYEIIDDTMVQEVIFGIL